MSEQPEDRLANLLQDGWVVAGYSSNVLAAGAMIHSMLLQKERDLITVTIVLMGDKETGRTFVRLSPMPPPKKGWF